LLIQVVGGREGRRDVKVKRREQSRVRDVGWNKKKGGIEKGGN
jgi:hypothetical protein